MRKGNRVVVVTGGSAGVGRAAARAFARSGASVAVIARGQHRLEETRAELEGMGRRALAISADVADARAIDEAATRVEEELGPIDCWVNNAMASVFAPVMEISAEEFKRVTEVTYLGVVHGSLAALRRMRPRERGRIIQVGSALAYRGIPLQAAYCASKHAIVGFTESLRTELMHEGSGVHVTMVHLPAMNTPQFDWVLSRLDHKAQPVPPIFAPEVAARAIEWSSRHARREVVVGFPTFKTIWGNRLAPWYVDRVLAKTGYTSQQTDEPASPDRPANLWEPVAGEYAAHGRFGDRSRPRSYWTRVSEHAGVVSIVAAVVVIAIVVGVWVLLAVL